MCSATTRRWCVPSPPAGSATTTVRYRRVELRYVDLKAGRRLQLTAYDETQAHTRNVEPGEAAIAEVAELLSAGYANWHVETTDETWQLRITKKGRPLLHRGPAGPGHVDRSHDRAKRRRLDEADPVFELLGISTADGKVKPSRMSKFRQVQDLLAALDPLIDDAVALGPGAESVAEPAAAGRRSRLRQRLPDVRGLPLSDCGQGAAGPGRRSRRQGSGARAQHRSRRAARGRRPADVRREPDRVGRARPMRPISCLPCMPATRRPTTRWRERCAGRRRSSSRRRAVITTSSDS